MNFEINGRFSLTFKENEALEVVAKEEKIQLKIKKISGVKKLLDIIRLLTEKEEEKQENNLKEEKEIEKALKFLKNQGYPVSIKLKGITIIKDLESSSVAKLTNFM